MFIVQVLRNLQRRENMLMIKLGILPRSQQSRNLENVLDLAAIHIQLRQFVQFVGSDDMLLGRVIQEVLPDSAA